MATSVYKQIEKARGKPIRAVLIEEFEQHGQVQEVAKALGASQSSVSTWIARCGLQIRQVLVEKVQA